MPDFFEEAFSKIEPKDDAQREKLETMRERFRQIRAETSAEIDKVRRDTQQMMKPIESGAVEAAKVRAEAARHHREEMRLEFEAQADLLERIAAAAATRKA